MGSGSASAGAELIIVKMRLQKVDAIFPRYFQELWQVLVQAKLHLKSFCIDMGRLTLGAGMTSADFQMSGMYLSCTEALNIAATGLLGGQTPLSANLEASQVQTTSVY